MDAVEPTEFWKVYKEYLRALGSRVQYLQDTMWTHTALFAAQQACLYLHLTPIAETTPHKVDLVAQWETDAYAQRRLVVALEHENGSDWHKELNKLAKVDASLRVLVTYHDFDKGNSIEGQLREAFEKATRQPDSVRGDWWLFVFGPRRLLHNKPHPFQVFTLADDRTVVPVPDDHPLNPWEWSKDPEPSFTPDALKHD